MLPSALSPSRHGEGIWHLDIRDGSEGLRCAEDNEHAKLARLEGGEVRMKEPEVLERIKMSAGPYKLQRSDLDDIWGLRWFGIYSCSRECIDYEAEEGLRQ